MHASTSQAKTRHKSGGVQALRERVAEAQLTIPFSQLSQQHHGAIRDIELGNSIRSIVRLLSVSVLRLLAFFLSLALSFSLSIHAHTHRVLNKLPCSHTHTTQIPHTHTFMSAGEETRHAASLTHQGNCIAFSRADLQRRAGQDVDLCYSKPRARFSGGIRHCLFKSHGSSDPTMRQAVSVFACAVLSCLLLV